MSNKIQVLRAQIKVKALSQESDFLRLTVSCNFSFVICHSLEI